MATAQVRITPSEPLPPEARMAAQLMAMDAKLDILTEQMGHLYRRTVALEELKDELMRIAKDGMAALTVELSEIEHEFNAEEIQHLLRKALRSTPRLIRLLDMLESVDGLVTEIEPLGKEVMKDLVCKLHTAEEKATSASRRAASTSSTASAATTPRTTSTSSRTTSSSSSTR